MNMSDGWSCYMGTFVYSYTAIARSAEKYPYIDVCIEITVI